MDPSVDEYLATLGLASPAAPAAPGAVPATSGPGGWETALRSGLLALGGFLAGRNGNLGSFTQGYGNTQTNLLRQEQARQQMELDRQETEIRRRQVDNQAAAVQANSEARRRQEQDRARADQERKAEAAAKAEAEQKKAETGQIQKSLDAAAANPMLNSLINAFGADAFTLKTPLGPMSLADAQARGAVVPGKLGHPDLPEPKRAPLITTPGPDGSPVRTEDKPGVRVYQRPRQPREPKAPAAPKTTRYTWKDDDPASDTYGQSFRIVEDEAGNVVSKTRLTAAPVAPAAPAGAPRKQGRFIVELETP